MNDTATKMYAEDIFTEARGWLLDCGMDEDEATEATDEWIKKLVDYHYDGGWIQFLRDAFPN